MRLNDMLQFSMLNNFTSKFASDVVTSVQRMAYPIQRKVENWVSDNLVEHFAISGHFDSYINKSISSILNEKYLSKKYGNTLIDMDMSFALCSSSVEKVKRKVSAFPELVNKSVAPGIYSLVMDDDMTRMIIYKEPILHNDDKSSNGIMANPPSTYITRFFFIGKNRRKWCNRLKKDIDDMLSVLSNTNQAGNKIRYDTLGATKGDAKDLKVTPMRYLIFPEKDGLLKKINDFLLEEPIYKEQAIPHRMGILLYGKPGVGKTAFAFSLAQHLDMECVSVNLDMFDKANGDSAFGRPNTVFIIDEIDSQIVNRSAMGQNEIETQNTASRRLLMLLRAIDSMDDGSIVVATTNYPEKLDPALRRSGRFDIEVEMKDLDYEYACEMVRGRDCDPEKVLAGESFPINPARLSRIIISEILKNKNIGQRKEATLEELGLDKTAEVIDEDDDTKMVSSEDHTDEDKIVPVVRDDYEEADDDEDDE